jgi:hypothetical protein
VRLRYIDAEDTAALKERETLVARGRALWNEIAGLGSVTLDRIEAVERCLRDHLGAIDPELEWEVSLGKDQGRVLLATGGEPRLRTLIEVLIEHAAPPRGWSWAAGRSAQPFASSIARVARITGIDLERAKVRVGFVRAHLLELLVLAPEFSGSRDEAAERASLLAVEALLGEELMERWIAQVAVAPLPRGGSLRVYDSAKADTSTLPLAELLPTVSHAIGSLYEGLPAEPCYARDRGGDWTMLEAEATPASDWPGQDDLLVATTMMPEMLRSFLCEPRFWSGRFSAHGESFCYVKIDQRGLEREARLTQRSALEDALDAALAPAALGSVVGNGFGVRYAYVVLALKRVSEGLGSVRDVCRAAAVDKRSWILFCDAELEGEWFPIWSDSPAPPMRST